MSTSLDTNVDLPRFQSISRLEVPNGRDGKHKKIMLELLNDIGQLQPGHALKIPLAALPDVKENIRAALSRATHQKGINVATSSDAEFLYIWRVDWRVDSEF
jgi:hypothetical protein